MQKDTEGAPGNDLPHSLQNWSDMDLENCEDLKQDQEKCKGGNKEANPATDGSPEGKPRQIYKKK